MAQHDMNVANQLFPNFRADMNNALEALVTVSAGGTEPSTTFPYMLWSDTTAGMLKQRNGDNTAWVVRGTLSEELLAARTAIATLTASDAERINLINATSAAVTLTLPAAEDTPAGAPFYFIRTDSTTENAATIAAASGDTINGETSFSLSAQWQVVVLIPDPDNDRWAVVSSYGALLPASVGAAALAPSAITGQPSATIVPADSIIFSDESDNDALKSTTVAGLLDLLGQSGYIFGLGTANNSTDGDHDIDISAGAAIDNSTGAIIRLSSGITKRADAAWASGSNAGGMDAGAHLDSNTWYYVWAISKADGTSDVLFSLSASAPTMPTDYVNKRLIWAVLTDGSGNFIRYLQVGDRCDWLTPILDRDATPSTTSTARILCTLSVPPLSVLAHIRAGYQSSYVGQARLSPTAQPDLATPAFPSWDAPGWNIGSNYGSTGTLMHEFNIRADTNSQIALRGNSRNPWGVPIFTDGWSWNRGRG